MEKFGEFGQIHQPLASFQIIEQILCPFSNHSLVLSRIVEKVPFSLSSIEKHWISFQFHRIPLESIENHRKSTFFIGVLLSSIELNGLSIGHHTILTYDLKVT